MTTVVHWFRRDLRVADNTSFLRAARDYPPPGVDHAREREVALDLLAKVRSAR